MGNSMLKFICKIKRGLSKATLFAILLCFTILSTGCNSKNKSVSNNINNETGNINNEINDSKEDIGPTLEPTIEPTLEPTLEPTRESSQNDENEQDSDNIDEEEVDNEKIYEKIELSMEEVIAIGEERAKLYYDNMFLSEVHSYDNDKYPSINAGYDGKREWWYVTFANEKDNYVNLLIKDGEVIEESNYDSHGNFGLIDTSRIKITSEEAANIAKELGLRGGEPEHPEEWVSGYNFFLSLNTLVKEPDKERLLMEVIGISPNGYFAHVIIDGETGEVLLAEEKVEYEDGTVEWKSFIN